MQINSRVEKFNAIKAVRQFTLDTFGTTAELRISREFIDALNVQIESDQTSAFDKYVAESLRNGVTLTQMQEVLRKYTAKPW